LFIVIDKSGRDINKAAACAKLGFEWRPAAGGDELLLPRCAAYYRVQMEGDFVDAGDHAVALVTVEATFLDDDAGPSSREPRPLSSAYLRERGLITSLGRAVTPGSEVRVK
jgi:hypothetical protein